MDTTLNVVLAGAGGEPVCYDCGTDEERDNCDVSFEVAEALTAALAGVVTKTAGQTRDVTLRCVRCEAIIGYRHTDQYLNAEGVQALLAWIATHNDITLFERPVSRIARPPHLR